MTAAIRLVPEALRADTRAAVDGQRRALTLALREEGAVIGGLVGQTFMGWLALDGLRVAAEHRGRGHATALIAPRRVPWDNPRNSAFLSSEGGQDGVGEPTPSCLAEGEARRRGATDSVLDTFSFQAPAFYRKLGYRDFARLDGFPAGHCRHDMTKTL